MQVKYALKLNHASNSRKDYLIAKYKLPHKNISISGDTNNKKN